MGSSTDRAHEVVIIADDLTGACDAAVHFAQMGAKTYIGLHFDDEPPTDWDVCAVNTDTRCSSPEEAAARTAYACETARKWRSKLILKKIDSMMRGNIAAEISAARAVLQPRITLLTPAFPALGRTVRGGEVHVEGGGAPISIAEQLDGFRCAAIPAVSVEELRIHFAHAVEQGIDILIPDTLNESGLHLIVEAAAGIGGLLWVGSGGLAQAIARVLRPDRKNTPSITKARKPMLLCVGSDHAVTLKQLERLATDEHPLLIEAGAGGYRAANAALGEERNVVLLLKRTQLSSTALQEFAESIRIDLCGGLVLTGGDTAMHILDALKAKSIRSRDEVLAGIPQGEIIGGVADGLSVITKSGAFGGPDALSQVIATLRAAPEGKTLDTQAQ